VQLAVDIALQAYEYFETPFTIADSACGSTFFVATGFHGLHVIIGTTFLATCLFRHTTLRFSSIHHFGFEAAASGRHLVELLVYESQVFGPVSAAIFAGAEVEN